MGAAKSGTTTLWDVLRQHPDVYTPGDRFFKEPCFFAPMMKTTIRTMDQYLALYADAPEGTRYLCDASTAYLTDPDSAREIYNFNKDAKIIITLRNPVDRAYSLYTYSRQMGFEPATTFRKALKLEKKRKYKKLPNLFLSAYYYNYMYVESGKFSKQVKRYLDLFGEDQVHFVKFKDLKQNTDREVEKVFRFLDLPSAGYTIQDSNPTVDVYSSYLQFVLEKLWKLYFLFKKWVLRNLTHVFKSKVRFMSLGYRNRRPKPMPDSLRQQLKKEFEEDIKALDKMVDIEVKDWLRD